MSSNFCVKFNTFKTNGIFHSLIKLSLDGRSIIRIDGSQVIIKKNKKTLPVFHSLKIDFALANSADPGEMSHYVAFHLGLHCLPKYLFRGFGFTKD